MDKFESPSMSWRKVYKLLSYEKDWRSGSMIGLITHNRDKAVEHYKNGGTVMVGEETRYPRSNGRWTPAYHRNWKTYIPAGGKGK